jgi:hypothetical protein
MRQGQQIDARKILCLRLSVFARNLPGQRPAFDIRVADRRETEWTSGLSGIRNGQK